MEEHDWWELQREKRFAQRSCANISLDKASLIADPAIDGVGKYDLSHKEAVIIFEQ